VAATLASWLALVAVGALRFAGFAIPPELRIACVAVAGPIALLALVRTVCAVWRGPRVIAFERGDAVLCGPPEAEAIRDAAQLRGTMGGAGHVYAGRLVFPVVAWSGALLEGLENLSPAFHFAGPWPFVVAIFAAIAGWVFPSRPYWYREVTGGGVVVSPPEAATLVLASLAEESGTAEVEPRQGS
jgi:hypothetical protein